jgi:hypothetical protein
MLTPRLMGIGPAARVRTGEKTYGAVGDCRHATVACDRLGSSALARSTTGAWTRRRSIGHAVVTKVRTPQSATSQKYRRTRR